MEWTNEKEEAFNEILDRICEGELVSKILEKKNRKKGYPAPSKFFEWIKDEERGEKYAHARAVGIEREVDEIKMIADKPMFYEEEEWTVNEEGKKVLVKVVKKMNYQQKAQMIDARKWRAGKMSGKYANKATVDLNQTKRVSITLDLGLSEDEKDEDEED